VDYETRHYCSVCCSFCLARVFNRQTNGTDYTKYCYVTNITTCKSLVLSQQFPKVHFLHTSLTWNNSEKMGRLNENHVRIKITA